MLMDTRTSCDAPSIDALLRSPTGALTQEARLGYGLPAVTPLIGGPWPLGRYGSQRLGKVGHRRPPVVAFVRGQLAEHFAQFIGELGLTPMAAFRGSVLSRWSMVVVEHDAV